MPASDHAKEDTHSARVLDVVEAAIAIDPALYQNLLVDAVAYYLVVSGEDIDHAIKRLQRSYTTILAAREHIFHGAGRA